MRSALIALGLLLLSLSSVPADDTELLPLEPGWVWHLSNFHDRDWQLETAGETVIHGRTVRVIAEDQTDLGSGAVLSAESYWSKSETGDLLFHGFCYPRYGSGEYYEPPITYIYYPWLQVGQEWTFPGVVTIFNEWEEDQLSFIFRQRIASLTRIAVPAGIFLCYGLDPQMTHLGEDAAWAGRGRSLPALWLASARDERGMRIFFSPGQGPVRRDPWNPPGAPPYLLDWWSQPLATHSSSWSGIKALY